MRSDRGLPRSSSDCARRGSVNDRGFAAFYRRMQAPTLLCLIAVILAPFATAVAQGRFAAADTDGNGVLSRAEVERALPRHASRFAAIDVNGDGNLSPEELRAYSRARGSRARNAPTESAFADHFRRADLDRDGALTKAEAEQGLPRVAQKFERIDANGDGRLSLEELQAWFATKRAARGKTN